MPNVYSFNDYDKYLSLKPGTGLWMVVLYLMHPYLLIVSAAGIGKGKGGGGGAIGVEGFKNLIYPDNIVLMAAIVATVPVMVFIYAWGRRNPDAPESVRKIWRSGRKLLVAAAALDALIVFIPLVRGHSIHIVGWIQLAIAVAIVIYLLSSTRVKDVLADFPQAQEASKAAKARIND